MKAIYVFLIFIFAFADQSFSASLDEKINFLITQKNYYQLSLELNQKHITNYINCLDGKRDAFTFRYFDEQETIAVRELSCEQVLSVVVRNRIQSEYAKMRILLALSRTARRDEAHIMSMSDRIGYKINRKIDHPHTTALTTLPFEIAGPEPLNDREVRSAMKMYNRTTAKLCQQFKRERLVQALINQRITDEVEVQHIRRNFCEGVNGTQLSSNTRYAYSVVLINYHRWLEGRRNENRTGYLEDYYKIINKTPYLLLLKNVTPTDSELSAAMNIISDNNTKLLDEFESYTQRNQINLRIGEFQVGGMNSREKERLYNDMTFYFNELLYERIAEYMKQKYSESLHADISHYLGREELKRVGKEIGLIVAGVGLCVAPVGRLFKLAGLSKSLKLAKIFKLGCFVSLGLPVNSWFVYDSMKRYEAQIFTLLSSPEGRHLMQEYNNTSDKDLLLNTLLIGVGVGTIKPFYQALKLL